MPSEDYNLWYNNLLHFVTEILHYFFGVTDEQFIMRVTDYVHDFIHANPMPKM